ncbi:hypothetical protein L1887_24624 [Cichorium endivia]|nr:hypothetical protein L1887_24624 [Cichorium endivia]
MPLTSSHNSIDVSRIFWGLPKPIISCNGDDWFRSTVDLTGIASAVINPIAQTALVHITDHAGCMISCKNATRQLSSITWIKDLILLGRVGSMNASTSATSSDHQDDFSSREQTVAQVVIREKTDPIAIQEGIVDYLGIQLNEKLSQQELIKFVNGSRRIQMEKRLSSS